MKNEKMICDVCFSLVSVEVGKQIDDEFVCVDCLADYEKCGDCGKVLVNDIECEAGYCFGCM